MIEFTIFSKSDGSLLWVGQAKTLGCLTRMKHRGTDGNGKPMSFKYDSEVHAVSTYGLTVKEDALFNFLYNSTDTSFNLYTAGGNFGYELNITRNGVFFYPPYQQVISGHKTIYCTNSSLRSDQDQLKGNIYMVEADSGPADPSKNAYLITNVQPTGSITLDNLNIHSFKFPSAKSFNIIDISGVDLSINNCIFKDNSGVGCNIKVTGDTSDQQVFITNSTFTKLNTKELHGSAIHYDNSQGTLKISECSFVECTGRGAIYTDVSHIVLSGKNDLCGNTMTDGMLGGGAIFVGHKAINPTISIDRGETLFKNNEVNGGGGAIYSNNILTISGGDQGILTFIDNSALHGGAIYSNNQINLSLLGEMAFVHNLAAGVGGAIYSGNSLTITGQGDFISNRATNGGAIYSGNGIIDLSCGQDVSEGQLTFTDNSAVFGGAINTPLHLQLSLYGNTKFNGNKALSGSVGSGGAIYSSDGFNIMGQGNATFTDNSAIFGGAIYSAATGGEGDSTRIQIDSGCADFSGCWAAGGGGAIYSMNATSINIINSNFNNNSVAPNANGGALHVESSAIDSKLVLWQCEFSGNTAHYGGGLYFTGLLDHDEKAFDISLSKFYDNHAVYGGGMYIDLHNTARILTLHMDDTIFLDNGGGPRSGGPSRGGALYLIHNAGIILSTAGGAGVTNTNGCRMQSNKAQNGGAIYETTGTNPQGGGVGLTFSGSKHTKTDYNDWIFESNVAEWDAGAVWCSRGVTFDATVYFSGNLSRQPTNQSDSHAQTVYAGGGVAVPKWSPTNHTPYSHGVIRFHGVGTSYDYRNSWHIACNQAGAPFGNTCFSWEDNGALVLGGGTGDDPWFCHHAGRDMGSSPVKSCCNNWPTET